MMKYESDVYLDTLMFMYEHTRIHRNNERANRVWAYLRNQYRTCSDAELKVRKLIKAQSWN